MGVPTLHRTRQPSRHFASHEARKINMLWRQLRAYSGATHLKGRRLGVLVFSTAVGLASADSTDLTCHCIPNETLKMKQTFSHPLRNLCKLNVSSQNVLLLLLLLLLLEPRVLQCY
jgi:hypothetical protein